MVLELALDVDAIFVIGNRVKVVLDLLIVRLRDRGKRTIVGGDDIAGSLAIVKKGDFAKVVVVGQTSDDVFRINGDLAVGLRDF